MIYATIMAGGQGERFWPKSKTKTPKQLLTITGKKTMIQETVSRIIPAIKKENILIITNQTQKNAIEQQLPNLPKKNIIAEPFGRNTAACIGYAALLIKQKDPKGLMVVLPADHVIKDKSNFNRIIQKAAVIADETESLVTIGIVPDFPSTGYGYIQVGKESSKLANVSFNKVINFKEKPKAAIAKKYFESKKYLFNSGMFIWRTDIILKSFKNHMPKLYKQLLQLEKAILKQDNASITKIYKNMESISIDYAIMEKAKNVLVTASQFDWDDVGSWSAIERHFTPDKAHNIKTGNIETIDTKNCVILGNTKTLITTIGLSDLIIVEHEGAILICDKNKDQQVKDIVSIIKTKKNYKKYL